MGQLVSDITEVLDYKESKKDAQKQRQEILSQMSADKVEKNNLIKKPWQPSVPNMGPVDVLRTVLPKARY